MERWENQMEEGKTKRASLTIGVLFRLFFGLAAIAFIGYCFYLGFVPDFGFAIIVVWTVVFAAIVSLVELIRDYFRR